jgi:hypothetical protein
MILRGVSGLSPEKNKKNIKKYIYKKRDPENASSLVKDFWAQNEFLPEW